MGHIAILVPNHWSGGMGGAEYQVKLLTEALVTQGKHRISWICRYMAPGFTPTGYEIHQLPPPAILGIRNPLPERYSTDFFRLTRLLDEIRPDVIYQRVGCAYTGIAARFAKRANRRMIWHVAREDDLTPHMLGLHPLNYLQSKVEKAFLRYGARHAHKIVLQTTVQRELLRKYFGRTDGVVVPNFHPLPDAVPAKDEVFTVAWIANFKFTKRPELFVALAEHFATRTDIRFVMAGSLQPGNKFHAQLHRRIVSLPNVTFLGSLDQETANQVIGRSHIFANTSTVEGLPNTFIQAWLRQTPVVSISVNPDHMLDPTSTGLYVGDFHGLTQAINVLAGRPRDVATMGKHAEVFARSHFSLSNVNRLVDLIETEMPNGTRISLRQAEKSYPVAH